MPRWISTRERLEWPAALMRATALKTNRVQHVWTNTEPDQPIEYLYKVASATTEGRLYSVRVLLDPADTTAICACPANYFNGQLCWHVAAVLLELEPVMNELADARDRVVA